MLHSSQCQSFTVYRIIPNLSTFWAPYADGGHQPFKVDPAPAQPYQTLSLNIFFGTFGEDPKSKQAVEKHEMQQYMVKVSI